MPEQEYGIAKFGLKIGDATIEASATVPVGVAKTSTLLPIFQGLTDTIVQMTVKGLEEDGGKVSCRAGCGACCSQIVPVSEHEARRIAELVSEMPEARRTEILERFQRAVEAFRQAGLYDRMRELGGMEDRTERAKLGLEYFAVGVPCPFLEDQSCGIYEDRPLRCREYLVTSPPEHCAQPTAETVKGLRMPLFPARALYNFGPGDGRQRRVVIPLIAVLDWVESQPEEELPLAPAHQVLRNFLEDLKKS